MENRTLEWTEVMRGVRVCAVPVAVTFDDLCAAFEMRAEAVR